MASNHTEHFSLNQWLPDDQVHRTDFNEDNAKLDAALNDLRAGWRKKPTGAALDALAAEVAKKATTAALEAVRAALPSIWWSGTYTGMGLWTDSRPISLGWGSTKGPAGDPVKDGAPALSTMITDPGLTCRNSHVPANQLWDTIIFDHRVRETGSSGIL